MTNLEYLLTRESIDNSISLCMLTYKSKHKRDCLGVYCSDCEFHKNSVLCVQTLLEEHKEPIKLTLHEKCILESLPNYYKYIARDESGDLFIYKHEPIKRNDSWLLPPQCIGMCIINMFKDLFKFIKWEDDEPYKIENILNDFEVVENVD